MATSTRRRKHWGWGYEDQQPDRGGVEGIARAVTDRLGFEVDEIEDPVPLDAVELREPRLRIPKRFADMFSEVSVEIRRVFEEADLEAYQAELLPRGWPHRQAYELFHRRIGAWHAEAQAYFALRDS